MLINIVASVDLHIYRVYFAVSLNQPSKMFGLILSGFISEKLGRKKCLILVSFLQILTSVAIHFSNSYMTLLVALTFSGGLNSMVLNPSFSFLSEISLIR